MNGWECCFHLKPKIKIKSKSFWWEWILQFTFNPEPADDGRRHSVHLTGDGSRIVFQQGDILRLNDPFGWNWKWIQWNFHLGTNFWGRRTLNEKSGAACDWPLWPNSGPCKRRCHCVLRGFSWKWANCGIRPSASQPTLRLLAMDRPSLVQLTLMGRSPEEMEQVTCVRPLSWSWMGKPNGSITGGPGTIKRWLLWIWFRTGFKMNN